jgi:hypothetical protein
MNKRNSTILVIIAALISIGLIPFVPAQLVDEFGPAILFSPLLIVVIVIVLVFFLYSRSQASNELANKRNVILNELSIAEKEFMQHKMDQETFDSLTQLKNTELIVVESELDLQRKKDLPKEDVERTKNLSKDKQKILLGLLNQKQLKSIELQKAEALYLKRKISENTYKKISSDIESEKVSIEAQIKSILNAEEIEHVKEQLKEGAKEIARQKKNTDKRKIDVSKKVVEVKESTLEDDVLEQVRIVK